ncbi:MAG: response regulator [Chloroflexi bacterium]|nr:response regulator [Chloroflexota bacterium]
MAIPLRLLLVEDSRDDAELVVRRLERSGFEIDLALAETEQQLRGTLAERTFDIIISDFSLPNFTGIRALEVTKELAPDVPFIVVSGTIGEERAVAVMKAGAADYVMKGNLQRLGPAVERELREAEGRRQRRRAEREREEFRAQLIQSQKMEVLGTFAGGIAHDFNNLLTVVSLNLQMVEGGAGMGAGAQEALDQIRVACDRASALVRQLLFFSRRRTLELTAVQLNELVEGVTSMLRRILPSGVVLNTERDPAVWPVHADASSLEQVVVNLVTNARDAMPNGGAITIRTRNAVLTDDEVRGTPGAHAGPHAVLSVADEGTGIDCEIRDKIFEPFFTTKPPERGTGLGLSTIYGIAEQHGGWVALESEVGKGSEFSVFLPRMASN